MSPQHLKTRALGAIAALGFCGAALAVGNHAGGHGAGAQESAIGQPGQAAHVWRTITVEMRDSMRFSPERISVRQGETVRFVVKNTGQLRHEFSLGTQAELRAHHEMMKQFPDMEHDEPGKVSLAPGKQGEVLWQFARAGEVDFACLYPGHYDAGMRGRVKVGKN